MLKERRLAAETVAEALFAAEKAIDTAIAQTANLAGLMPTTRQDARLSAIVGQEALMRAIETMQALGVARQNIVETHKQLSVAQRDIGLGAVAFGNAGEKPDSVPPSGRLGVVGRSAA
ncbi:hypothetical protein [Caulobacter sp. RHG1]|uniref:hypothetical protein n=1 Tax=Caulobacter sp. (strain RHG1) TaxID=2545762 RepID=UPI0015518C62|nr:hypothetical protein [Caulobacter sp. RHG1]NQE63789.1 hypothetical protein [Caulobacter sp. RHG1]